MVNACAWLYLRLNGLFQTGAHMALEWYQQVRQLMMYFPTGWVLAAETTNYQADILAILQNTEPVPTSDASEVT